MVPADGSRGWPQSVQQYNTTYSKHISQDICKDRASLSIIYTQTAEEAGLSPPLPRSSQGWTLGVGEKSTTGLLLHTVHISINSSLAFDVHSLFPLTVSVKRRQNIFSYFPLGGERKQHLLLPRLSCHLRQGCLLLPAPSSSSSAAHRVLARASPNPRRACPISAAQWDQCKSPSAALHLRSAGRADEPGSNRRKQNKRKKKKDKG